MKPDITINEILNSIDEDVNDDELEKTQFNINPKSKTTIIEMLTDDEDIEFEKMKKKTIAENKKLKKKKEKPITYHKDYNKNLNRQMIILKVLKSLLMN